MSTTRLYFVRHGRAAAGWDAELDPGLDELGHQQAREMADQLAPLGPMSVMTSPLLRCQQTAVPLCEAWNSKPEISPEVGEIPSPEGVPKSDRVVWLRKTMGGTWLSLGPRYTIFRDEVVNFIRQINSDTVIFSHFMAINAVIGRTQDDDRLVLFRLDNCSITSVELGTNGNLKLIQSGREADTLIR
ncbi:MAG: histidine phosphatase family protein [Ilumatobacteraceae bacterium]